MGRKLKVDVSLPRTAKDALKEKTLRKIGSIHSASLPPSRRLPTPLWTIKIMRERVGRTLTYICVITCSILSLKGGFQILFYKFTTSSVRYVKSSLKILALKCFGEKHTIFAKFYFFSEEKKALVEKRLKSSCLKCGPAKCCYPV